MRNPTLPTPAMSTSIPFQYKNYLTSLSKHRIKKKYHPAGKAMVQSQQTSLTAIPTQLGWIALHTAETTLLGLTFGHRTKAQAIARYRDIRPTLASRLPREMQRLADRVAAYASGEFQQFGDVRIDQSHMTAFQLSVVSACREIPWGETMTYGDLAASAGSPRAARAVGSVMSANRFPIIVPCHRVVSSTAGGWGGFTAPGGIPMKKRMVRQEQQLMMS